MTPHYHRQFLLVAGALSASAAMAAACSDGGGSPASDAGAAGAAAPPPLTSDSGPEDLAPADSGGSDGSISDHPCNLEPCDAGSYLPDAAVPDGDAAGADSGPNIVEEDGGIPGGDGGSDSTDSGMPDCELKASAKLGDIFDLAGPQPTCLIDAIVIESGEEGGSLGKPGTYLAIGVHTEGPTLVFGALLPSPEFVGQTLGLDPGNNIEVTVVSIITDFPSNPFYQASLDPSAKGEGTLKLSQNPDGNFSYEIDFHLEGQGISQFPENPVPPGAPIRIGVTGSGTAIDQTAP